MALQSRCSAGGRFREQSFLPEHQIVRIRPALLLLLLITAACKSGDDKNAVSSDSARLDSLRAASDSIARDMARVITDASTRTGSWTSTESAETSEWAARMQGEHVSVIEERVTLPNGTATRGFFFASTGALEQVSEQKRVRSSSSGGASDEVTETRIDFTGATPVGTRVTNGQNTTVDAQEIEQYKRHAAILINAARNSSPGTTAR